MHTDRIALGTASRWLASLAIATVVFASGHARAQSEEQELVNEAETTFANFMRDPDTTWLQRHIGSAKGVLIAPKVVKAGWILGGSGGRAVLFARNDQGRWTGPAFYNIGAASVGFQAGVSVSETMALVMTEKAMNSLLATTVKLGADASIAAGPIGTGAKTDVATDFVAFSRAKGVYGGLSLEGSVIDVADNRNRSYYGAAVLPPEILMRASVHNPQADRLTAELARASSVQRTSLAQ